jgi:hypothetical protein
MSLEIPPLRTAEAIKQGCLCHENKAGTDKFTFIWWQLSRKLRLISSFSNQYGLVCYSYCFKIMKNIILKFHYLNSA